MTIKKVQDRNEAISGLLPQRPADLAAHCHGSRARRGWLSEAAYSLVAALALVAEGHDSPLSDFDDGGPDEGPDGSVDGAETTGEPSEFPSGEDESATGGDRAR